MIGFEARVDYYMDLADYLTQKVRAREGFQLVLEVRISLTIKNSCSLLFMVLLSRRFQSNVTQHRGGCKQMLYI